MFLQYGVLSHWTDQVLAWFTVIIVVTIATFLLQRRSTASVTNAEKLCGSLALALVGLSAVIGVFLLVGWVFLTKFKVVSALWFFWPPIYVVSVIAVSQILPLLTSAVTVWALIGAWKAGYSSRSVRLALTCVTLQATNLFLLWLYP